MVGDRLLEIRRELDLILKGALRLPLDELGKAAESRIRDITAKSGEKTYMATHTVDSYASSHDRNHLALHSLALLYVDLQLC